MGQLFRNGVLQQQVKFAAWNPWRIEAAHTYFGSCKSSIMTETVKYSTNATLYIGFREKLLRLWNIVACILTRIMNSWTLESIMSVLGTWGQTTHKSCSKQSCGTSCHWLHFINCYHRLYFRQAKDEKFLFHYPDLTWTLRRKNPYKLVDFFFFISGTHICLELCIA